MNLLTEDIQTGEATYCPEDNKLRLYVGRVPRPEFEVLRAEGWTSTPKQDCDFAATWTPERHDTATAYGEGIVGDEDQCPEDRAADRAERFAGYRDKRTDEATGHADRYDDGPAAHGYQSAKRAERAAARHDRQADKACDAWSKAEYWTARTAGVIAHALYQSRPGVRMGRINRLESELRRTQEGGRWHAHLTLRLAYERQMLAAQGGTLESAEKDIEVGGTIGGKLILKVCKSNVTKRAKSVKLLGPGTGERWTYRTQNIPGTDKAEHHFDLERLPAGAYKAPTPESLAKLEEVRAAIKATRAKKPKAPPLVNPTDEDAERLQAIWNVESTSRRSYHGKEPAKVVRMTQARYSAMSKGSYSGTETKEVTEGGPLPCRSAMRRPNFPTVAKVRALGDSVVILSDKPQKAFPAQVWKDPRPDTIAECKANADLLRAACRRAWLDDMTPEEKAIFQKARMVGIAGCDSMTQFRITEAGAALLAETAAVEA